MNTIAVVTTINPPTDSVKRLAEILPGNLVVVGDRKTPAEWACDGARFLSMQAQEQLPLALASHSPKDHYARKNIGYLHAMLLGADVIYDTDDDNIPNDAWVKRGKECRAEMVVGSGWCNAYEYFTDTRIWPRGLPLDVIDSGLQECAEERSLTCPIQQGLADGAPDVDAIWRIAMRSPAVSFSAARSVALGENVWCPFNSQSTWWFPEVFPLMYLPIYAPFRMTDIWRSFVAQRCLWAAGFGSVVFHSPSEVFQDRNPHDLLRDFKDEVSGYLNNNRIVDALKALPLGTGKEAIRENMISCYSAIVALGVLPAEELVALGAWLNDVKRVTTRIDWVGGKNLITSLER